MRGRTERVKKRMVSLTGGIHNRKLQMYKEEKQANTHGHRHSMLVTEGRWGQERVESQTPGDGRRPGWGVGTVHMPMACHGVAH